MNGTKYIATVVSAIGASGFALWLILASISAIADPALPNGQSRSQTTTTTTTTTTSYREGDEVPRPEATAHPETHDTPAHENTMTARFGSKGQSGLAGCKTDELATDLVKDLKGDCNAWVKDQKAGLKDRFLLSTCEESCEDCGMSLKRCSVMGSVRYLVK